MRMLIQMHDHYVTLSYSRASNLIAQYMLISINQTEIAIYMSEMYMSQTYVNTCYIKFISVVKPVVSKI